MKKPALYNLDTDDGIRQISIKPVHQLIPGTKVYATGVFSLTEGKTDLGDIVFDDSLREWEYTGMGDLNHEQAAKIAIYIKNNFRAEGVA